MVEQIDFTDIYVDDAIVNRVSRVLESTRYVKGPVVEEFEAGFAAMCGVDHAIAVNSGTAALFLALKASGVGPGDEVFVPGHTFFATASPVLELGATPVFVDIDPESYTMDPEALADAVEDAGNPAAVMAVHLYGHPADMDAIGDVADDHDLLVIEDACQAHGATFGGERAGSFGDAGCFSFYPSKNMTVGGDGGMVTTDDADLAAGLRELRNHGRNDDGEHVRLGLNYRLNDVKAAVGVEQLGYLPTWNRQRRTAAHHYSDLLADIEPVATPAEVGDVEHVYHLYVVQVPAEDRDSLRTYLDTRGISTDVHYGTPAHRHPSVVERVGEPASLAETDRLVDRIVSLPMHPRITMPEVERVCAEIEAYFEERARA